MATKKYIELQEFSDEDLKNELVETQDQYKKLKFDHAIKGLEAQHVFVMGANVANYPCKAKDHKYVDLLAGKQEYDRFEEERRLFYVACTRAKHNLYK